MKACPTKMNAISTLHFSLWRCLAERGVWDPMVTVTKMLNCHRYFVYRGIGDWTSCSVRSRWWIHGEVKSHSNLNNRKCLQEKTLITGGTAKAGVVTLE